ncbi:hypothetical protein ZOSMA_52G00500 [Zostera marina]|uniref:C2H2-type domain-containing protein n=1 Tax=Zostera marina TaxID=29655 RepID=A0A0K9NXB6_ZOSMR|nr:hypothetical protein ZOSMA_52G00500 [Zostera marina]
MAALEFWGVEVKPGKKIICQPGDEKFIHLSQAALGEVKDKSAKSVQLTVNFEGSKFVIGTLSSKSCTQIAYDVVFQKNFELSHNWNDGSVFFIGYKTQFENGGSEDDSETEKHAALVNKKVKTSKINAKPAEPNKDGSDSNDDVSEDGSDDDASEEGSDNDDAPEEGSDDDDANEVVSSDDAGDNDSSDEEKSYSFKAETSKKRTADSDSDSESKVPKKKVKLATPPGKTGVNNGKMKSPYTVTPYPTMKQTSKSAAKPQTSKSVVCKSCGKRFISENALQSHIKAKHG